MLASRSWLSVAVVLLFSLQPLAPGADPQPARDDTAVHKAVTSALEAMNKSDWKRLAKHLHPDALKDFRDGLRLNWAAFKKATAPGAGMAYVWMIDALGAENLVDKDGKGLERINALMALEPEPFFARVLENVAAAASKKDKFSMWSEYIQVTENRVIGTVYEKKDLAHVIVERKRKLVGVASTSMDVLTMKQSGSEWKIVNSPALRTVQVIANLELEDKE